MGATSGPTITNPTAGQVLHERTYPSAEIIRLGLIISATYNFDALLEIWDGAGAIMFDMVLPVLPPMLVLENMGPFMIPANGRVRILSRNNAAAPGPVEVQATLNLRSWGER